MTLHAIIDADPFASFIEQLDVVVDEAILTFDDEGLRSRAVDPANVAMVDTELGPDAFESLDVDGVEIGVNLSRLEDLVAIAEDGDLVELELNQETQKLHIEIRGDGE